MTFVGHVMKREKIKDLCLIDRIPVCKAKGGQREMYMDGIITVADGSKAPQILQIERDERCGNPWSPTSAGVRHCDNIHFHLYRIWPSKISPVFKISYAFIL